MTNGISQIGSEGTSFNRAGVFSCNSDLFGGITMINVTGKYAGVSVANCGITRANGKLHIENSSVDLYIPEAHEILVNIELINVTSVFSQIYYANLSHALVSGFSGYMILATGQLNHGATIQGVKRRGDASQGIVILESMKMFGDFKFVNNSEIEMSRNNFTGTLECSRNRKLFGKFNRMRPSAITVIGDCSSTFIP